MKVTVKVAGSATVFVAESSYAEKDIAKSAGFRWHIQVGCFAKNCAGCVAGLNKVWFTADKAIAARLIQFADSGASAALSEAVATVVASRAQDAAIEILAPEGLAYRPFQKAGIAYMTNALRRFKGVINGDDMGLGKTIQTAGLINASPEIKSVLMICPQHLRINWKKELAKWLTRPFSVYVIQDTEVPPADADFVVVNYDKLAGSPAKVVVPALMARNWDLLVCDEAQYLKNPKAQRTVAVLGRDQDPEAPGLVSKAAKLVLLTGTPIENRPIEFHGLLAACAPTEFPFWGYAKRYCGAFRDTHGWDFSGATHLDELQARVRGTVMVRRLQGDVLKELPPFRRQIVALDNHGVAAALAKEQDAWDAYEAAPTAIAFTELATARRRVGESKVPVVIAHVKEMLESGVNKIVVFAYHHSVLNALTEAFGAEAVTFTGETSAFDKDAAVTRFQNDASVKVFIGQIKAAGTGITLTAACREVFAEIDWNPAIIAQAEKRCARIGQTFSVLAQHLVYENSLDARMLEVIISKQDIADRALDVADPVAAIVPAVVAAAPVVPAAPSFASDRQQAAAHLAMRILAARCDGAQKLDGAGFNKHHSAFGHSLAVQTKDYTAKQFACAKKLATFYRRQLPAALLAEIAGNGLDQMLGMV